MLHSDWLNLSEAHKINTQTQLLTKENIARYLMISCHLQRLWLKKNICEPELHHSNGRKEDEKGKRGKRRIMRCRFPFSNRAMVGWMATCTCNGQRSSEIFCDQYTLRAIKRGERQSLANYKHWEVMSYVLLRRSIQVHLQGQRKTTEILKQDNKSVFRLRFEMDISRIKTSGSIV